jgi:hypothetical protein
LNLIRLKVDGTEYEYDLDKMLNVEAIAIERATGMTYPQFGAQFYTGSVLAITALIWVIRKRQDPKLRFDEVVFEVATFESLDDEPTEGEADPKAE